MRTTGIFTVHTFEAEGKYGEPTYIIPFGDIHRFADECHVSKWKSFLEWAKTKERCYFIGMGDYDDLASTSEREVLEDARLHNSTKKSLKDAYLSRTLKLYDELKFMRGRVIGLIEGNHYAVFNNGMTTTQKLCEMLDCKYLGCASLIRFYVKVKKRKSRDSYSVDIFAYHGKGAARLIGSSLNTVQQMAETATADIYLMGHDHKKSVGMVTKLELSRGSHTIGLRHRKQVLARTGSFLKGYENNMVSYIADKCLNPTDLGVVKIELTPKRQYVIDDNKINYLDIHASI